jgi:sugar lactone lactonase YvrE
MPGQLIFTQVPLPVDLVAAKPTITVVARTCLLEGPAFDGDDNLFFSDIISNRVYRLAPNGTLSIFQADSGRTNGNTFDSHGLLISCEGAEFGPGPYGPENKSC